MMNNLDAVIYNISPHYTNDRFRTARSVWGKEQTGLHYDYSDRLWEWDYKKCKESFKVAVDSGNTPKSARYYQTMLSHYYDKNIEIAHILAGFNLSNGYPYQVFGYRIVEQC